MTTIVKQPILIVEDEEGIQDLLLAALRSEYQVRQAKTAAEARTALSIETPAAVILDYRLPDRTGLDVLRDIRSAHPQLPVIMITGYGSESVCLTAFRLGVADYFSKPMSIFALAAAVRKAIDPQSTETDGAKSPAASPMPPIAREADISADVAVQRAVLLIQQRYWDRLSLGRVAAQLGASKYGLSRRFSQIMGVSFRRYLLDTRLERAKHLLVSGSSSITEIAHAVGFNDLPRFDKLFRRLVGVSPSKFRSQRGAVQAE